MLLRQSDLYNDDDGWHANSEPTSMVRGWLSALQLSSTQDTNLISLQEEMTMIIQFCLSHV